MDFQCYELLHAGEGPRGQGVLIMGVRSPECAAKEAADSLDEDEKRRERYEGDDPFDGSEHWIEVETPDGPIVFCVRCHVGRAYTAIAGRPFVPVRL